MSETDEDPPAGWSGRGIAALGMSVIAGAAAFILLYGDRAQAPGADGLWLFVTETLVGHLGGGFVAGWLLGGTFGRLGIAGWPLALVGGVLASLLAGLIGAAIASLPGMVGGISIGSQIVQVGVGVLVTPLAIEGAPWFGIAWLIAVLVLHVLVRRVRRRHAVVVSA
ncbi:MAG: hypothetical protein AAFU80_25955 [Pseudomonadota bacterium]